MNRAILQITFWIMLLESSFVLSKPVSGRTQGKNTAATKSLEVPRALEVQYDDYPMVVPKRAAMLLDRLMVALHHALEKGEGEDGGSRPINKVYRDAKYGGRPVIAGMVKQQPALAASSGPNKAEQLMKSYYAEAEAGEDLDEANVIPDDLDEYEGRKELLDEMFAF
ncbi:uncharacterized protein LOC129746841 isoform X3 [Uranotaenia lowii]|uniref:uncharacterized protein LOC129746841 isoform X3 n=1 Tax=Uranotaenia lowii TaxID=190385 RepID=UPI00247B07E8|nr:uncharacterized protein LOC129746841 isoform X3 [Uranotaenia lowii]